MADPSLLIMYTSILAFINFYAKNTLNIFESKQLVRTFYVMTSWRSEWNFRCVISIHISFIYFFSNSLLTHWCRVTHICVRKLNIIDLDNVLSHGRRQAIIWTNAGILLIGPSGTNFSEILIDIYIYIYFHSSKCIWKCIKCSGHFVSASMC